MRFGGSVKPYCCAVAAQRRAWTSEAGGPSVVFSGSMEDVLLCCESDASNEFCVSTFILMSLQCYHYSPEASCSDRRTLVAPV